MPEKASPPDKARPFPWRCVECGERAVFPRESDYTATVKHDGRAYEVRISNLALPTCRKCGEQVFTSAEDERIRVALREQLGLLTPQDIRAKRDAHELSQQELADQLGVAKETISRWETGALMQSRAMDNLLRLYFESDEVRWLLRQRFAAPRHVPA